MADRIPRDMLDIIAIKSAELSLSGVGVQKQAEVISKELNLPLNYKHIERYRTRDAFKNFMLEATEDIRKTAKAEFIRRASNMVELAGDVIMNNLKDNNLNAVTHVMKLVGFGEEEKATGSQSLTVIMPGAAKPAEKATIEIEEDETDK